MSFSSIDIVLLSPGNEVDSPVIKGPWHQPVTYASKVLVKRVFRGEKKRFEARSVIVEGLGNPKICVSRPKIGDTRIFFTDHIRSVEDYNFPADNLTHFRLRSSILRVTIENLRVLWDDEKNNRMENNATSSGSGRKTNLSTLLRQQILKYCLISQE